MPICVRIPDAIESAIPSTSAILGAGQAQPAQRGDRLDPSLVGAIGDGRRRGGAILQTRDPLRPVASQPLARGALADSGRRGGLRQRPPRDLDPLDQQLTALDAETSVSVQLHPVSSSGLVASTPTSLQGGPDEQRDQELHLAFAPVLIPWAIANNLRVGWLGAIGKCSGCGGAHLTVACAP